MLSVANAMVDSKIVMLAVQHMSGGKALTLLLGAVEQNRVQSKCVAGRQQRFGERNRPVWPVAV